VEGMWLMLQQDEPDDYVLSTGVTRSIEDFLNEAFAVIGVTDWSNYVKVDERYMRPAEVDVLKGDSSKAHEKLGWAPKTSFSELVKRMVNNDIELLKNTK
jgi:GDPmannose 4,6-dehydratase